MGNFFFHRSGPSLSVYSLAYFWFCATNTWVDSARWSTWVSICTYRYIVQTNWLGTWPYVVCFFLQISQRLSNVIIIGPHRRTQVYIEVKLHSSHTNFTDRSQAIFDQNKRKSITRCRQKPWDSFIFSRVNPDGFYATTESRRVHWVRLIMLYLCQEDSSVPVHVS